MDPQQACQELQRLDASPPARQEPQDLLALAVKQGASVDTLERLMVVRTQLKAETAREAYFASLAAFQAECPIISKRRKVAIPGGANYAYAPLEEIVVKVQPLLEKHGFSHQEDSEITEGWVTAVVTITHRLGHAETKRFKVPSETKAGMSPQQKYGAAMTFATRYAFCAALGIRTGETDTDCAPTDGPDVKAELKSKLWNLLKPVRGAEANWKQARQWLVDEMCLDPDVPIQSLDADGFRTTIKAAAKKLEGK